MQFNVTGLPCIELNWEALRDAVVAKGMLLQYVQLEDRYELFAFDDKLLWRSTIWIILPEGANADQNQQEKADFEVNYKTDANRSVPRAADGAPVVAPASYAFSKEHAVFQGFLYQPTPEALSMFDELITKQIYIQGGTFWCTGAALGDYAELSVVDKDDVLGMFGALGLVVGQDVLEIYKYVRKLYMKPGSYDGALEAPTAGLVREGLYMRCSYNSLGNGAVAFSPTYLWYEV